MPSPSPSHRRSAIAGAIVVAFAGIVLLSAGLLEASRGVAAGQVATSDGSPAAVSYGSPAPAQLPADGSSSPGTTLPGASGLPRPSSQPSTQPSSMAPPPIAGPVAAAEPALVARLQLALDEHRLRLGIPGVSATVILPDGSAWSGASGMADVARGTPATTDTAYAYASMSKTFTAALILQLVGEGQIELTAPALTYLPRLPIRIDRGITVAMLLDHTSGLDDFFLNPKIDPALQSKPTRTWTVADALAYVRKPAFPPGRGWRYSNTNYLLLGLIVEKVTARPLAVAIRQRLLDPLELDRIWYQAVERPRDRLAHGYRFVGPKLSAKPIDLADGSGIAPFRSVVTAAGGAGSMAGTSGDLARWARALYGGDVLGPRTSALMLEGFTATAAYEPKTAYGYGVQAAIIDGRPSLGHSGRFLGFRGAVRHLPADGLTIAVLTNQSRADPGELVRALLAAITPPPGCPRCAYVV